MKLLRKKTMKFLNMLKLTATIHTRWYTVKMHCYLFTAFSFFCDTITLRSNGWHSKSLSFVVANIRFSFVSVYYFRLFLIFDCRFALSLSIIMNVWVCVKYERFYVILFPIATERGIVAHPGSHQHKRIISVGQGVKKVRKTLIVKDSFSIYLVFRNPTYEKTSETFATGQHWTNCCCCKLVV